jgi:hypothetical protein
MQLTWNHLWFLPYLLAYSLIVWTLYPILIARKIAPLLRAACDKISMPLVIFFPVFAFYGISWALYAKYPTTHNFVEDWFNHARSFFSFLLGFMLVQLPNIWKRFAAQRWLLLCAAMASYGYIVFAFNGGSLGDSKIAKEISSLLWSVNTWMWMLCLIAWAQHKLTSSNPILRYLNSGVFCFYILHQTLIIIFAYFLAPLKIGFILEPILIIILVTASCLILFEIIRRLPFVPIVFGVQAKKLF